MSPTAMPAFHSIDETVAAFRNGEFIVVLDDEDRENEGDLIIAAEDMNERKMAFMIEHTSGLICTPITASLASWLSLPQMVESNTDRNQTAFTVTIDADDPKITTGISAHDRALTCQRLAECAAAKRPSSLGIVSFRCPGHILPLQARPGGVLARHGHTEATIDFCRLAGKIPVGVICELVERGTESPDAKPERIGGGMMRRDGCLEFGRKWNLKVCTIQALREHLSLHPEDGIPANL